LAIWLAVCFSNRNLSSLKFIYNYIYYEAYKTNFKIKKTETFYKLVSRFGVIGYHNLFAQVPQGFSYQGVAKTADGEQLLMVVIIIYLPAR